MRERLREITDHAPLGRVVFFGQQSDVIAQRQETLEQRCASSRCRPSRTRLSASQKLQARKAPSRAFRPSLLRRVRSVAPGRRHEMAPIASTVERIRGSEGGRNPTSGISSVLASSSVDP